VWRRLKRCDKEGVWVRIWHGKLDWSLAFLDGSLVPANKGSDKVGLTKQGEGMKWMVVVDGNRLPLGFHLDSANSAGVWLAEQTVDTSHVLLRARAPQATTREVRGGAGVCV